MRLTDVENKLKPKHHWRKESLIVKYFLEDDVKLSSFVREISDEKQMK